MESAKGNGFGVHFVTLTIPHGIGDDLHDTLARLSAALKRMSSDNTFRRHKAQCEVEIVGYIRAQEVTYGDNGWHPHYHLLVFTKEATCGSSVIQYLYSGAWRRACLKAGLPEPHPVYGCTVQDGAHAARYASKWGIEDEMTKGHTKKAKRHGLTPWGLLRAVLDGGSQRLPPNLLPPCFAFMLTPSRGAASCIGLLAFGLSFCLKLSSCPISKLSSGQRMSAPFCWLKSPQSNGGLFVGQGLRRPFWMLLRLASRS